MVFQEQGVEPETDAGAVAPKNKSSGVEVEQPSVEEPGAGKNAEAQGPVPPQTAPLPTPLPNDGPTNDTNISPKVRWKVEYRQELDHTLVYTRDVTDAHSPGTQKQQKAHTGPVFEVIDVYYTPETKDTNTADETTTKEDTTPSLSSAGRQFIRIYSRSVINALQSVTNYYPNHAIAGNPVDIDEPYAILVHHREALEVFRERFSPEAFQKEDEETKACILKDTYEHLGYILQFLQDRFGDKLRLEQERWAQPVPKASFQLLWLLLKPGMDVYVDQDGLGLTDPFVISHVRITTYNKSITQYTVRVWHLIGDDIYIFPSGFDFRIGRFDGEKPINKLEVFPCKYLENHAERKATLIQRGKLYFQLRQKRCMYFDGECSAFPRRKYKGYVMCDPTQYTQDYTDRSFENREVVDRKPSESPYCTCQRCSGMETEAKEPAKFNGYSAIAFETVDSMTEHQYFICTRDTPAFIFQVREWVQLLLDGFREPQWDIDLMDNLVLTPHYKNMIQSLSKNFMEQKTSVSVKSHDALTSSKEAEAFQSWSADFIENKGKGLILLLHGKPGVGKTYTAECISQHVRRPLLPISCADIGVDPSQVEKKLVRWFKIAHSWDAVMLLDEADIYMEYRQIHDLTRNNLVASFLRAMEYYEGILFLTTNRVGTFDEAFLSRISLAIYYPEFQNSEREQIWNNFFEKLEREAGERFYVPESTKEYATKSEGVRELKWNGREIRNAFQIAVSLAQAEGTKDKKGRFTVKRDHIKVTAELSKEFKDYMVSVHTKNESQRAQLMGYRYDAFSAPAGPKQEFY